MRLRPLSPNTLAWYKEEPAISAQGTQKLSLDHPVTMKSNKVLISSDTNSPLSDETDGVKHSAFTFML